MCSVDDHKRFLIKSLESPRPAHLIQSLPDSLVTDPQPGILQCFYRFQHSYSIVNLISSCQIQSQILILSVGKSLSQNVLFQYDRLFRQGFVHPASAFFRFLFENRKNFFPLSGRYYHSPRFYDSGFRFRNLLQRISQNSHMIHTDRGKYTDLRRLHNIRCIQESSHSGLQHNIVTSMFSKIQKCDGRLNLKYSSCEACFFFHLFCRLLYFRHKKSELVFRHPLTIDLKSFHIVHDRR